MQWGSDCAAMLLLLTRLRTFTLVMPRFSRPSNSSSKPGRLTTTPLPITHSVFSLRMPEGMRCSAYLLPSSS